MNFDIQIKMIEFLKKYVRDIELKKTVKHFFNFKTRHDRFELNISNDF